MEQIIENDLVMNFWDDEDINVPDWYEQNGITLDERVDL